MILMFIPTILLIIAIIWSKKHSVQQNTEDIMIARIHWITLIPSWFMLTIAPLFLGAGTIVALLISIVIVLVVLWVIELIFKIPLISCWIDFFATELSVTPTRLVGKTGLFNVKRMDIPTDQITAVTIKQSLWGQLLKYSDIVITTAGADQTFKMIRNATEFQRYCLDVKEKKEDRQIQKQADAMKDAFSSALKENQQVISSESKYCSACGAKVSPGAAYCPSCGAKIN